MTFDEALELARTVRLHYRRLDVLAIGRFKPPEELDRGPEDWGVSLRVDRGSRPMVAWSPADIVSFADSPATRTGTNQKRPRRRAAADEPLLF